MIWATVITFVFGEPVRQPDLADRALAAWTIAVERFDRDVPNEILEVWSIETVGAINRYGYYRGRLVIPPELVVAVAWRESAIRPDVVMPGCPRRGPQPKYCNRDGRPDVGLCQLRVGPSWSRVDMTTAKQPIPNIRECVRQLREHYLAHRTRGCEKRGWADIWSWGSWADHHWLQHHNPASRDHGEKVVRLWRAVKKRVQARLRS